MGPSKSLDSELELFIAILRSAQSRHSEVFTLRALRLTVGKLRRRYAREGICLLTKTLPRLGKALDRALTGEVSLDCQRWRKLPMSKLPRFLGEFFQCIFSHDGLVLPTPSVECIKTLRLILYCFYKYELPYNPEDEDKVVSKFLRTELDLVDSDKVLVELRKHVESVDCTACKLTSVNGSLPCHPTTPFCGELQTSPWTDIRLTGPGADSSPAPKGVCNPSNCPIIDTPSSRMPGSRAYNQYVATSDEQLAIVYRARRSLSRLFSSFDVKDIRPRHGPGAVSTKEKLWEKYQWSRVSERITRTYPLDEYFYSSLGHVCDRYQEMQSLDRNDAFAKVCLVPKDSRGPRLISCEPVDFQWIQQGLGRAIVKHVEHHPLTRYNVHFTDQQPNQFGALLGSSTGRYATLDLNEASDRVSCELVRLLFPEPLLGALMNCRTTGTELPSGEHVTLRKFAPMGSSLCFPVLALTVWALLDAGAPDATTRESVLVYGDDVVVTTAYAGAATKLLESFGLKVNRDKSCTCGFFRESCGVDAFRGVNVTPVRFRTLMTSSRSPNAYVSWVAYANSLFVRGFHHAYDWIVEHLVSIYGEVPEYRGRTESYPTLMIVPEIHVPKRQRVNRHLQKMERFVWCVSTRPVYRAIDGWSMLLRYFAEASVPDSSELARYDLPKWTVGTDISQMRSVWLSALKRERSQLFSVRSYTKREASLLVKRWR